MNRRAWSGVSGEQTMSDSHTPSNERAAWDALLEDIVDYVRDVRIDSPLALQTAHYCLMDTLGCGLEALSFPA
jgi:2-methylcitrate dehydratase